MAGYASLVNDADFGNSSLVAGYGSLVNDADFGNSSLVAGSGSLLNVADFGPSQPRDAPVHASLHAAAYCMSV